MLFTKSDKKRASKLAWLVLPICLTACGGGANNPATIEETSELIDTPPPITQTDNTWQTPSKAIAFINRATFGATPADLQLANSQPASEWFKEQLAIPPSYIMPAIKPYTRPTDFTEPSLFYIASTTFAFWQNAILAQDQLRQRVAFALSEILVTSTNSGDELLELADTMAAYQDILIKHAFGNYRDLLHDVTYSPAMGFYLTYLDNVKGDDETGRKPDENYARELLQLFTIGVEELNLDGSVKLNAQGKPFETYTNQDIQGLARVFTGLNLNEQTADTSVAAAFSMPMSIYEDDHSQKEKRFLGHRIAENTGAQESIKIALDVIFSHPNVAPFITKQLIQRLVTSNLSNAYVQRVASVFETGSYILPNGDSVGQGRRGDLAATVAAILFDSEALNLEATRGGKIREPIIRFTQWARAFEVKNIWPHYVMPLWDTSSATSLAQHPYRSPSVFNFFRPGYKAPGSVSAPII